MLSGVQNSYAEGSSKTKANRIDQALICSFSIALIATLALSFLYGLEYGSIDKSAAIGSVVITNVDSSLIALDIDEELNARIKYRGYEMAGTLNLSGADKDSVLYQLVNIECSSYLDSSEIVFYIRMPRSGIQGDYLGPWATYFSFPSENIKCSDWLFVLDNGQASVGQADNINAITMQKNELLKKTVTCRWEKRGSTLLLIP